MKSRPALYFVAFLAFLAAGLTTAYFSLQPDSTASIADQISDNLKQELRKADNDLEYASTLTDSFPDPEQFSYPVFRYQKGELVYWSDNTFVPSIRQVSDTFDVGLFTTGSEAYLLKKKKLSEGAYLISAIQLLRKYPISNDYLTPEFNAKILPSANVSILEPGASLGIEVCPDTKCLFRISILQDEIRGHHRLNKATLILLSVALVIFLMWGYSLLPLFRRKYTELAFFYLLLIFLLLRVMMTSLAFPSAFIKSQLFDPQIFASSSLNASLGDLFLNMITVLALCFFVFRNYFRFYFLTHIHHPVNSWVIAVSSSLCVLFAALFPVVVIQTLYNNSTVALDITQSLRFDSLRVTATLSVLIAGICAFLFSHAFIRILVSIGKRYQIFASFLIAAVIFSAINEFNNQQYFFRWSFPLYIF